MTVIAWDGFRLAADKRATNNGCQRTVTKIRAVNNELIGYSGDLCNCLELETWYINGAVPHEFPSSCKDGHQTLVVIGNDKTIYCYISGPVPEIYEEKFHAWGSGRDFALAAMYFGFDAQTAVKVASHFQVDCGNGIDIIEHSERNHAR